MSNQLITIDQMGFSDKIPNSVNTRDHFFVQKENCESSKRYFTDYYIEFDTPPFILLHSKEI